jgi:hypothetical protein
VICWFWTEFADYGMLDDTPDSYERFQEKRGVMAY